MKIEVVGLNSINEMEVSIIDKATYHFEWYDYDINVTSYFCDRHVFVDEYVFTTPYGGNCKGVRTVNAYGEPHAYGAAADLIKRFVLRMAKSTAFAEDMG